jgi:hypothetical protein
MASTTPVGPISSLDGQTPDEAYFTALPSMPMAA